MFYYIVWDSNMWPITVASTTQVKLLARIESSDNEQKQWWNISNQFIDDLKREKIIIAEKCIMPIFE